MSKQSRKERKAARESVSLSSKDIGSVSAVLGEVVDPTETMNTQEYLASVSDATPATEPAAEPAAPAEPPVALGEALGKLELPPAPDGAAVVVAAKGEPTRRQPTKLNHGMVERGVKVDTKGLSNANRRYRAGKGTGRKANTVWGFALTVAQALDQASENGIFTGQQFYNKLFQSDWLAAGVTRAKYTSAHQRGYAGWIQSIVQGGPGKTFQILVPVPEDNASE